MAAPRDEIRPGRLIASRYEIVDRIGGGVMGAVFRAKDTQDGRLLAVKLLRAQAGDPSELHRRFLREIQVGTRLDHPNIVKVIGVGESDGWLYMAMELLDGKDLRATCARAAEVPLADKLKIMQGASAGLAHAHSLGVVHRDVKPANMVLTSNGQLKLIDFGLARVSEGADLTRRGIILGSPDYMSPEQAMGGVIDLRTDMFSAGSVFYELLTGKKPFRAKSLHAVLFQIISGEPAPLAKECPDLPAGVAQVVERMMAKAPDERFASLDEVATALQAEARRLGRRKGGAAPARGDS